MTGNIDMKRPATPIYGISNTQDPYQVFLGPLEVTGKITFVMDNDSELLNFLNNTQPALVFNWAYGAGASAVQIQATLTKGAYTTGVIERGEDFVQVSVDFNAQANTTDDGASGGFATYQVGNSRTQSHQAHTHKVDQGGGVVEGDCLPALPHRLLSFLV
jgi:hypothetical protein